MATTTLWLLVTMQLQTLSQSHPVSQGCIFILIDACSCMSRGQHMASLPAGVDTYMARDGWVTCLSVRLPVGHTMMKFHYLACQTEFWKMQIVWLAYLSGLRWNAYKKVSSSMPDLITCCIKWRSTITLPVRLTLHAVGGQPLASLSL